MHHKYYDAQNQDNVNESVGYVKCEKPKQPKNDQNGGDYPKHIFISFLLSARTCATSFFRTALMPLPVRENTEQTLD
jgi:hypothetical protein